MAALPLLALLISLLLVAEHQACEAKSITIGDDLSTVVDNEEDDDWKSWAGNSRYDDPTKKAATFAMIKLVYKANRDIEEVRDIADRWTKKLQTGAATVGFKPIDPNTLFINLRQDDEIANVKQFVLEQPETYEIMIDGRTTRRNPDDPSVEEAGADIEKEVKRRLKRERMLKKKMEMEAKRRQDRREGERQKRREERHQRAHEL